MTGHILPSFRLVNAILRLPRSSSAKPRSRQRSKTGSPANTMPPLRSTEGQPRSIQTTQHICARYRLLARTLTSKTRWDGQVLFLPLLPCISSPLCPCRQVYALRSDPSLNRALNRQVYALRSQALLAAGRLKPAVDDARRSLNESRRLPNGVWGADGLGREADQVLGMGLSMLGEHREAVKAFEEGLGRCLPGEGDEFRRQVGQQRGPLGAGCRV